MSFSLGRAILAFIIEKARCLWRNLRWWVWWNDPNPGHDWDDDKTT